MQGHLGQVKWLQSSFEMFSKSKSPEVRMPTLTY